MRGKRTPCCNTGNLECGGYRAAFTENPLLVWWGNKQWRKTGTDGGLPECVWTFFLVFAAEAGTHQSPFVLLSVLTCGFSRTNILDLDSFCYCLTVCAALLKSRCFFRRRSSVWMTDELCCCSRFPRVDPDGKTPNTCEVLAWRRAIPINPIIKMLSRYFYNTKEKSMKWAWGKKSKWQRGDRWTRRAREM